MGDCAAVAVVDGDGVSFGDGFACGEGLGGGVIDRVGPADGAFGTVVAMMTVVTVAAAVVFVTFAVAAAVGPTVVMPMMPVAVVAAVAFADVNRRGTLTPYRRAIITPAFDVSSASRAWSCAA